MSQTEQNRNQPQFLVPTAPLQSQGCWQNQIIALLLQWVLSFLICFISCRVVAILLQWVISFLICFISCRVVALLLRLVVSFLICFISCRVVALLLQWVLSFLICFISCTSCCFIVTVSCIISNLVHFLQYSHLSSWISIQEHIYFRNLRWNKQGYSPFGPVFFLLTRDLPGPLVVRAAFNLMISSWNSRSNASFGSSLIFGLFFMFFARLAYLHGEHSRNKSAVAVNVKIIQWQCFLGIRNYL